MVLLLWQLEPEGLNFGIEFPYSFHQTFWKSDPKKPLKIEIKHFIDLHFQLLNNFSQQLKRNASLRVEHFWFNTVYE